MNQNLQALIGTAKAMTKELMKVAADKPSEHELHSDAKTFRNTAGVIFTLCAELERAEKDAAMLRGRLQRIANLEVRGAADAVSTGDWKAIVEELEAVARDALTPHVRRSDARRSRRDA